MADVNQEAEPPPPRSWSEVIDRAKVKQGVQATVRLVGVAKRGGHDIGRSTLSKFENDKPPQRTTQAILEALHFLSGVPLAQLIELSGTGDATQPPFSGQVASIQGVNFLTRADRQALEELIRQVVNLREEIINLQARRDPEIDVSYLPAEAAGNVPDILDGNHHTSESTNE